MSLCPVFHGFSSMADRAVGQKVFGVTSIFIDSFGQKKYTVDKNLCASDRAVCPFATTIVCVQGVHD